MSQAEFSRAIGVSPPAVRRAILEGRLTAYSSAGRKVRLDYPGKKFLRWPQARIDYWTRSFRLDDRTLLKLCELEDEGLI